MSDDIIQFPQYVAMRKSPTAFIKADEQARCVALLPQLAGLPFVGNDETCVIFNPYVMDQIPDRDQRRKVLTQGFEEVRKIVGAEHVGDRYLAVQVMVSILDDTVSRLAVFLEDVLSAARAAHMPVLINLDAVNWWEKRPDLWNFFDPSRPGYNTENVDNVEWTGFTSDTATRVFWRNWGSQIRVETPIPNLGGQKFRAVVHDVLVALTPHIVRYFEGLAPDERYLYAGTIIGTELAIGVNHYHYPNGNIYVNQPKECDPGHPIAAGCPSGAGICSTFNHGVCPPDFTQNLSGNMQQVGFHAALDLRLVSPGEPLTQSILDHIVRDYVAFFDAELRAAGLPASQIYSHTGGIFGTHGPHSFFSAKAATVIPGWSMYGEGASKPSIAAFTDSSEEQKTLPWASPEWLPLNPDGSDSAKAWQEAIESSLNFRNNRMLSLANWEGIYKNANAINGTRDAFSTPDANACVTVPRVWLGAADFGDTVGVRFSKSRANSVTYLNASTSPTQRPGGGLANIDVANVRLGDETSYFFAHDGDAIIYAQLVTDGCYRDGAGQRVFSEILSVSIHGSGQAPPGPRIYTMKTGAIRIFSWDVPQGARAVRFQIALDTTFSSLIVDDDVTGKNVFARDGFAPEVRYYARAVADGTPSNTVDVD